VHAVDDPSIQIDEADVEAGRPQFNYVCGGCHGINLLAVGAPGPDLRESAIAMNLDSLTRVVHDGALQSRGMPRYEMFTPTQIRQLHAFIRAKTRETLGTRKPSTIPDAAGGK
jgi:quinohemoprotein ethanol dehydrogenase